MQGRVPSSTTQPSFIGVTARNCLAVRPAGSHGLPAPATRLWRCGLCCRVVEAAWRLNAPGHLAPLPAVAAGGGLAALMPRLTASPSFATLAAGKISMADMVRPIKAPPPPPPGLAPPARQRGRKQAGAAAAGAPPAPPRRQVVVQPAPPPPPPSRKQLQQQARAAAAATRAAVAPNYDALGAGGDGPLSAGSASGAGGLRFSSKLKFPPGRRPVELQASRVWLIC